MIDFSDTPSSKQTARIMAKIKPYLRLGPLSEPVSDEDYAAVYQIIKVELLAATMVSAMAAKQNVDAKVPK